MHRRIVLAVLILGFTGLALAAVPANSQQNHYEVSPTGELQKIAPSSRLSVGPSPVQKSSPMPPRTDDPGDTIYYEGPFYTSLGNSGSYNYIAAVRFTMPVDGELVSMIWYQADGWSVGQSAYVYLYPVETSGAPGVPIDSVYYSDAPGTWQYLVFPNTHPYSTGEDFFVGVHFYTAYSWPMSVDAGPLVALDREWIYDPNNGGWSSNATYGLPYNYLIRAIISQGPPATNDVKCSANLAPAGVYTPGDIITPSITIKNSGLVGQTNVPYGIEIYQSGSLVYSAYGTYPQLDSGMSADVTFTPDWTIDAGTYNVKGFTYMTGDEKPNNDTCRTTVVGETRFYPLLAANNTGSCNASAITQSSIVYALGGGDRGWMRFDITDIPDGATINSTVLHYYCSSYIWPYYYISRMTQGDPLTEDVATLYADCAGTDGDGYYAQLYTIATGWNTQDLGAQGNMDVFTSEGQNYFAVGFHDFDGSYYNLTCDGWNEANVPYLIINYTPPPANDMGAITPVVPSGLLTPGDVVTPACDIKNWGTADQSNIPVSIQILQGGLPVYTGTATYAGPLSSFATATVTFAPDWTAGSGAYTIKAWTDLAGDARPENDTVVSSVYAGNGYKVLVAVADDNPSAFIASLLAAGGGEFIAVDYLDLRTNFLDEGQTIYDNGYRVVLTYPNYSYYDMADVGNKLADFVEVAGAAAGGGVVAPTWCEYSSGNHLGGRFMTRYFPGVLAGNTYGQYSLGTVFHPEHDIMQGVSTVSSYYVTSMNTIKNSTHADRIADFSNGSVECATYDSGGCRTVFSFQPVWGPPSGDWLTQVVNEIKWCAAGGLPRPAAFDLLTPANHAINVPAFGTMTWEAASGATSYEVYYDIFTPPTTLRGTVTGTSYAYSGLNYETQYYWLVKAVNTAGKTTSTSTFDFFTGSNITPGWAEKAPVPGGGKSKNLKEGANLTYLPAIQDEAGSIYAFKGNNRYEFYQYNLETDVWTSKESIPAYNPDGKKKTVKKGSVLVAGLDDDNTIYASKGNNTVYFWQYDPATGLWAALQPTVPSATPRVRGLKEGTGAVAVNVDGQDYLYLLKGSGTTEFYRLPMGGVAWETMEFAPLGPSNKPFKNGSKLAFDGDNTIYAMKGSYNTLYAYDVALGTWTTKDSVPKYGTMGKKKKVKDGSGLAYANGLLYVLKGGNTNEFFSYDIATSTWSTLADMPVITNSTKRVKGGGGLTYASEKNALYAFRGNNTLQFWAFGISAALGTTSPKNDIMSGAVAPKLAFGLRVSPNPFTNATAISYTLPKAGNVSLKLYDVTGTLVTTLAQGYTASGSYSSHIDATKLARGIYVLKFAADGYNTTRKLILQ